MRRKSSAPSAFPSEPRRAAWCKNIHRLIYCVRIHYQPPSASSRDAFCQQQKLNKFSRSPNETRRAEQVCCIILPHACRLRTGYSWQLSTLLSSGPLQKTAAWPNFLPGISTRWQTPLLWDLPFWEGWNFLRINGKCWPSGQQGAGVLCIHTAYDHVRGRWCAP